jgi:hypothetical protein
VSTFNLRSAAVIAGVVPGRTADNCVRFVLPLAGELSVSPGAGLMECHLALVTSARSGRVDGTAEEADSELPWLDHRRLELGPRGVYAAAGSLRQLQRARDGSASWLDPEALVAMIAHFPFDAADRRGASRPMPSGSRGEWRNLVQRVTDPLSKEMIRGRFDLLGVAGGANTATVEFSGGTARFYHGGRVDEIGCELGFESDPRPAFPLAMTHDGSTLMLSLLQGLSVIESVALGRLGVEFGKLALDLEPFGGLRHELLGAAHRITIKTDVPATFREMISLFGGDAGMQETSDPELLAIALMTATLRWAAALRPDQTFASADADELGAAATNLIRHGQGWRWPFGCGYIDLPDDRSAVARCGTFDGDGRLVPMPVALTTLGARWLGWAMSGLDELGAAAPPSLLRYVWRAAADPGFDPVPETIRIARTPQTEPIPAMLADLAALAWGGGSVTPTKASLAATALIERRPPGRSDMPRQEERVS